MDLPQHSMLFPILCCTSRLMMVLTLAVISQQVVEDGYEFFAKRQLVTIFSAPNYCGEFDNAGAMMSVDETLMCSFQVCFVMHASLVSVIICAMSCLMQ